MEKRGKKEFYNLRTNVFQCFKNKLQKKFDELSKHKNVFPVSISCSLPKLLFYILHPKFPSKHY